MKIAIFGATGMIGSQILHEALKRGHRVTVVTREPSKIILQQPNARVVQGDVLDANSIAQAIAGTEIVISAIGPNLERGNHHVLVDAANALLTGLKRAEVQRLIAVNGAGSLEVEPGMQLMDTPQFPEAWRGVASAHRDALEVYRANTDLDWTVASPPAWITPGERSGHYRTATDQLLVDEEGQSRISTEDFAVALLDEAEKPQFRRKRFTVGY